MLLFRAEEHIEKWCVDWSIQRGETMTTEQCWRLAQAWHGKDRRESDWRRRTLDEAQAIFDSIGLTSSFWSLSG